MKTEGIDNLIFTANGHTALAACDEEEISVVLLDLYLPDLPGMNILVHIKTEFPHIPVLIITAWSQLTKATECIKKGAFDFLTKPIEHVRFITCIRHALKIAELKAGMRSLTTYPWMTIPIITMNKKMFALFEVMEDYAKTGNPVLISGETGVGKELAARAIHELSSRKGLFVAVNGGSLTNTLFEDTLFGHKKGAFTSALTHRDGLISKAAGGSLFLDEIGDLSLDTQVKLLRLFQENTYYQVGSDKEIKAETRFICATNKDINQLIKEKKFREDLFYRFTHKIKIPSLRERSEDIPLLLDYFLDKYSREKGIKKPYVPEELFLLLKNYSFPGNVRELENCMKEALARHRGGTLSMSVFKKHITESTRERDIPVCLNNLENYGISYAQQFPTFREIQRFFILEALRKCGGKQSLAAQLLGISPHAIGRWIKKIRQEQGI